MSADSFERTWPRISSGRSARIEDGDGDVLRRAYRVAGSHTPLADGVAAPLSAALRCRVTRMARAAGEGDGFVGGIED